MPPVIKMNNQILIALRKHYGLSIEELARRAKIDADSIKEWEELSSEVAISELTKLARPLKRNWTVFLLESVQLPDVVEHDNRSIGNQKTDALALETVLALERAERILKFVPEVKEVKGLQLPTFTISRNDDPEDKGEEFRRLLQISTETQLALETNYQAFNFWKDAIADMGIYVAEMPLPNETIKAFSMMRENEAIIVLSTKDTVYSRIFSLFHELCHILLRHSNGICDFHVGGTNTIETFCNYFAAAFLLNRKDLTDDLSRLGIGAGVRPPESVVKKIANAYQVSMLVVYRRLVSTGHISSEEYGDIHDEYMARYWSYQEGKDQSDESAPDYFPFYKITINSRGKRFVQDVFNANADGRITYRDIGIILDVTQKQIPKLKESVFNTGGS